MYQWFRSNRLLRQRVAFYFALTSFLWFVAWICSLLYFESLNDPVAHRAFVTRPGLTGMCLISVLSWIIACHLVGSSILEMRQISWFGILTLIMLAVPAVPIAIAIFPAYWQFFRSEWRFLVSDLQMKLPM